MVKKILSAVAVIVFILLAYVASQPSHYMISRETIVNASPEKIFPFLNSSQKMNEWMPWKDQDSQIIMTYEGPQEGVGSISSWTSPGQMGTGKAEIIESIVNQSVKTKITYLKPMEMTQVSEMSLHIFGETTKVKWSVEGENSFMGKLFSVFINMDKMVGSEFEKGLAKLKNTVEQP